MDPTPPTAMWAPPYLDTAGSCRKSNSIFWALRKSAQQGKQQRSSTRVPLCRMTPTCFLLGLPKLCKTAQSWVRLPTPSVPSLCPLGEPSQGINPLSGTSAVGMGPGLRRQLSMPRERASGTP